MTRRDPGPCPGPARGDPRRAGRAPPRWRPPSRSPSRPRRIAATRARARTPPSHRTARRAPRRSCPWRRCASRAATGVRDVAPPPAPRPRAPRPTKRPQRRRKAWLRCLSPLPPSALSHSRTQRTSRAGGRQPTPAWTEIREARWNPFRAGFETCKEWFDLARRLERLPDEAVFERSELVYREPFPTKPLRRAPGCYKLRAWGRS